VVLPVEHDENDGEHVSMIARILQLLLIDILTVGRENSHSAADVFHSTHGGSGSMNPAPAPVPDSDRSGSPTQDQHVKPRASAKKSLLATPKARISHLR
jgi:hypothetical protein